MASAKALAAAQPALRDVNKPAPSLLPSPFAIRDLDLSFVIDTTGSMRHEIADMQANLIGVINILNRLRVRLRTGVVAYKDRGEVYLYSTFRYGRWQARRSGRSWISCAALRRAAAATTRSRSNSASRSRSVWLGELMHRENRRDRRRLKGSPGHV